MTTTVGQIIERQASRFAGREAERSMLRELLVADGPLVVFVHGIAGVGKSALVRAFAAEARSHGAAIIGLDCGSVEPTERGLLAAIASATGEPQDSLESVVARLAGLARTVVLTLDTYELFRGLDPWLVRDLVPALPANVRLVLAGREAPLSGWTGAFGGSFRRLPLGSLSPRDAETVLRDAGVPATTPDASTASVAATRCRCCSRQRHCVTSRGSTSRRRPSPPSSRSSRGSISPTWIL